MYFMYGPSFHLDRGCLQRRTTSCTGILSAMTDYDRLFQVARPEQPLLWGVRTKITIGGGLAGRGYEQIVHECRNSLYTAGAHFGPLPSDLHPFRPR